MSYLSYFHKKILKYDITNKFLYKNTKEIPQLKKIILNFGCKDTELKNLAASLLALELITKQKGTLTTTKHSNIVLKIRKGNPVGCKVSLQKERMFIFIEKLLNETFPKVKNFNGMILTKKMEKNIFSFQLRDIFSFTELENHYYLFNNVPKLDMTIITNSKTKKEITFLLKLLQLPLKN